MRGLPAKGGEYSLYGVSGVELEFLGLDRFHNTPRGEKGMEREEELCKRMRQLGAAWEGDRTADNEFEYYASSGLCDGKSKRRFELLVGWPAGGGIWVLRVLEYDAEKRGVGVVRNAFTIDERCEALEELGGIFYEDAKQCQFLDLR